MGHKLKISVIIPTWNRASTIEKAIRSALNQTYQPDEVLVCDDGSTDKTKEIVCSIGDTRVKWLEGERSGRPSIPRNRGIKIAKGKWLAFLDSDDYWHPQKLEKQLKIALEKKTLAICCNANIINNRQKFLGKLIKWDKPILTFNDLMKTNYVICSSVLLHKSLIQKCKGFPEDEELKAIEDYAFWLRVATQTNFIYLNQALLDYTDEPKTSIRKPNEGFYEQKKRVLGNFLKWKKNNNIPLKFKLKVRLELFKLR